MKRYWDVVPYSETTLANNKHGYRIRLLERVITILDCFQDDKSRLGITEISKRVGLHKSTVHRLLEALASHRLLRQDSGTDKYSLGMKLFELGSRAAGCFDVREHSMPVLEQLVAETGETAHLCVLDDNQVLYIEKFESAKTIRMPSRVGQRNPCHCTAVGKILLAYRPDALDCLLESGPLKQYTRNTISEPAKLRQELAWIRRVGYSIDNEEIEVGLKCVGAPVRNHAGEVIAAISIAGPNFRVTTDKLAALSDSVKKAANTLSEKMGYRTTGELVRKNGTRPKRPAVRPSRMRSRQEARKR